MDSRKVEKVAAISIAVAVTGLSLFHVNDWERVGIFNGCSLWGRVLYPFFHAGLLHAALNAWCLLSIVFVYDVSIWRLLMAYVVAVTMPVDTLGRFLSLDSPTVGLSGMVYFLFGSISFSVARKGYFQFWMFFYLAIGFIMPNTNAWLHLYCYVAGLLVALLNKPINVK